MSKKKSPLKTDAQDAKDAKDVKAAKDDGATDELPMQQPGDTPVEPWNIPDPAEKAAAEPMRDALKQALREVDSPEKADQVAEALEAGAAGKTEFEVEREPAPSGVAPSAREVKQAGERAEPGEATQRVLEETAREVVTSTGREREALSEAAHEVLNPEQQGVTQDRLSSRRALLREAILRRMKPYEAVDARIFLAINHLPHSRASNAFFYFLTFIFNGGAAWFGLMGLTALLDRRLGWRVARHVSVPLVVTTAMVEYPIKAFFRRQRPFITVVQALVIGKKPGTWSFPSGHSAAAFSGAWLLGRYYPRMRALLFGLAGMVAFSRIYLGDHFPGDVASGSMLGVLLAETSRRVQQLLWRRRREKRSQLPRNVEATIAPHYKKLEKLSSR